MLTRDDLKKLASVSGSCLTIIQPLKDDIRPASTPEAAIKAAIQEARRLMTATGFDVAHQDQILLPVRKIAAETDWTSQRGSLVAFSSTEFSRCDFWHETFTPRVNLDRQFFIVPLLPALQRHHDFWLLAVSIKKVRLYRGSLKGLAEVELPESLATSRAADEAFDPSFDPPDHTLRARSNAGPSAGTMQGVQFGTGSAHEREPVYLHDFFRAIDHGIRPILSADPQPLILAAVSRELAIYRKVNTYAPLLDGDIHGSPESLGVNVLYAIAVDLIAGYSSRPVETILRETEKAVGRSLVVTDPNLVAAAASVGLVEELIVSPGAPHFGQLETIVNRAALSTIRNSGVISVLAFPPATTEVTAICASARPQRSPWCHDRCMKAAVLIGKKKGSQEPLHLEEVPRPLVRPGHVLLKILACGVCRTDLHIVDGELPPLRDRVIPGHQIVGEVVDGGTETLPLGTRVGVSWMGGVDGDCPYCMRGSENLCDAPVFTGYSVDGGYAEYAVARADFAFPLPAGLDDTQAAPLLCAGIIGFRSLRVAGVEPGDHVGLFGFGASAHLAISVLLAWKCKVYVSTRGASHRRLAETLGATWVGSEYETPPIALDRAVTFAPSGDVVIAALGCLRKGGIVAVNAVHLDRFPEFDYDRLLWGERQIRSVTNMTRADARGFLDLAASTGLRPRVTVFPLDRVNDALMAVRNDSIDGAAVIIP